MRFHLGEPPSVPDFIPDASWQSLREPTPWVMQLWAVPIGIVTAVGFAVLWNVLTPIETAGSVVSIPVFLGSFAGIVVVHEFIHAVVHPFAGLSPRSVVGFWPSRIMFYATYTGELTRNRFVLILAMPLIVISILPLVAAATFRLNLPWLAFVSVFNALLACGDLFGIGLVMWQVPMNAIVCNQGWKSYWKRIDAV